MGNIEEALPSQRSECFIQTLRHSPRIAAALPGILFLPSLAFGSFLQSKVQTENQGDDAQNQDDGQENPPLEPSCTPSRLDALVQLLVGVFRVVLDLHSLFFGPRYLGLLVHNLLVELCKEQRELAHRLLDTLNVVVACAHGAKHAGRLAAAVRLELLVVLAIAVPGARPW